MGAAQQQRMTRGQIRRTIAGGTDDAMAG